MASRILLKSAALRPAASFMASRQVAIQRGISSSPALRHKESDAHNTDSNGTSKHKDDLMKKHKDGNGHWKPELASDSEEAVKADKTAKEDHKALQERTKRVAEEKSKAGTSMHDGL